MKWYILTMSQRDIFSVAKRNKNTLRAMGTPFGLMVPSVVYSDRL
jgi:hypothetical protein